MKVKEMKIGGSSLKGEKKGNLLYQKKFFFFKVQLNFYTHIKIDHSMENSFKNKLRCF